MSEYIVLTKSGMRKPINGNPYLGVCVAAYSLTDNKLVRFVQEPYGAPLKGNYVYEFNILDEVEVKEYKNAPEGPQTENLMIKENGIKTIRSGSLSINDIAERVAVRFDDSFLKDMKPFLESVEQYQHSIEIVRVEDLQIRKPENSSQPRATFKIGSRIYRNYRVTDGPVKSHFEEFINQPLQFDEAYLVITIPSIPYDKDGKYYKMVAAVYPQGQVSGIQMDSSDELPF